MMVQPLLRQTKKEFEAVVGPCKDEKDIVKKARDLMKRYHIENLLVTRSEHGMMLIQQDQPELNIPTKAKEVYDVTGAGDTVIGVLAASVAAGLDLVEATKLSNVAAGIVVSKLGAATTNIPELCSAVAEVPLRDILSEDQLHATIKNAQACGETVVMTNGCFDILHAGHIHYLEQAKSLGASISYSSE